MKRNDTLLNEAIKPFAKEVRCMGDDGTQYGIIRIDEAIEKAYEQGIDAVLIAKDAKPPVVKLMDFNKYRYQAEKKRKEARKKQKQIEVKEIKLTPKIAQNDINYKVKHAIEFLESGKHVRFKVFLRGREFATPQVADNVLVRVREMVKDCGEIEKPPVLEGKNMIMHVIPIKENSK